MLRDWLGEGGHPVPNEIAAIRAAGCHQCPKQFRGRWWDKIIKDPIAIAIRAQIAWKNEMQVSTPYDRDLEMCSVCGCCTQLKVHVPLKHILAHTPPEVFAQFPPQCWIAAEANKKP